MILFTHGIVGGAIATIVGHNPLMAFCTGFASHFVLDMIPHWDYHLASGHESEDGNKLKNDIIIGPAFYRDLVKIGLDATLGILIPVLIFGPLNDSFYLSIFLGALGGILPDFLQFAYYKLRIFPLNLLQRFHIFIHAKKTLKTHIEIGAPLQIIFVILITLITFYSK